jgi:1,4-dihydroxy-2-naphthoate octaprenyltransferase
MSLSCWDEGSDSDHVRGVNRDTWLVGHCKILAWQRAKLPRYGREGAVEVRPFPAKKRLRVSEAQGLSGEAMKGNPTTTVILRVDESKSSLRTSEELTEPPYITSGDPIFSKRRDSPGMSSDPSVDAKKPPFIGLWLKAMRVPFLQATFVPIILGGVIAWETLHVFNWNTFLLTLLGASLIQIASNMFNDYFDFKSGNDLQVRHQNPFAGGGRILTAGLIKPSTHLIVSTSCLILGSLIGFYLIFQLGLYQLFWFGLIGVVSTYFYVGPPFKLAYRGVGEFLVGVNFGPVMTLGAYYVQTGSLASATVPLLASIPVGLLIAAVLWINEFPDMDADKAVGKKTLVLRLGYLRSVAVYVGLLAASYLLLLLYAVLKVFVSFQITSFATLIALFSLPFALKAVRILRANYKDPHAIIPANANTIILHLAFGLLAIVGFVIGGFAGL